MDTAGQQQNVLSAIREAVDKRVKHEDHIRSLVLSAREHDCSWSAIGQVLGISRQAAWERYGGRERDAS